MYRGTRALAISLSVATAAIAVAQDPNPANPGGVAYVNTYFPSSGTSCTDKVSHADGDAAQNRVASPSEQCVNVGQMYFVFKGSPRWSTETFFEDGEWLKITEEMTGYTDDPSSTNVGHPKPNGEKNLSRVFRDHAFPFRKGLKWMPLTFSASSGFSWRDTPIDLECYDNGAHGYQCYGVPCGCDGNPCLAPGGIGDISAYTVILAGWLSDARSLQSGMQPPRFEGTKTVYAVVKDSRWYSGDLETIERYTYGKISVGGLWYGIGLVKFEYIDPDPTKSYSSDLHYLVDCDPGLQCNSCPDP
jgi:hypothetical protein